jgi:hypothetical protein
MDKEEEFNKRYTELERFIHEFKGNNPIHLVSQKYNHDEFIHIAKGLEQEPERGKRCLKCYRLRLEESFKYAKEHGFDYITTTLTLSPYKNSVVINEIGKELEEKYNFKYLYSDFKKRDGYKRSIVLSHKYHLYRQNYCGCEFSKKVNVIN